MWGNGGSINQRWVSTEGTEGCGEGEGARYWTVQYHEERKGRGEGDTKSRSKKKSVLFSVQPLGCCWLLLATAVLLGFCAGLPAEHRRMQRTQVGGEGDWVLGESGSFAGSLGSFGGLLGRAVLALVSGLDWAKGRRPAWAWAGLDERRAGGGGGAEKKRGTQKKRWRA